MQTKRHRLPKMKEPAFLPTANPSPTFQEEESAAHAGPEPAPYAQPSGDPAENGKEPAHIPPKYPCPCCGCRTLPVPAADAIAYICPVCFWENDVFLSREDEPSDENHGMTLREARDNFKQYHACDPRFLQFVRAPFKEEQNG